jgi:hypothetical protein
MSPTERQFMIDQIHLQTVAEALHAMHPWEF